MTREAVGADAVGQTGGQTDANVPVAVAADRVVAVVAGFVCVRPGVLAVQFGGCLLWVVAPGVGQTRSAHVLDSDLVVAV